MATQLKQRLIGAIVIFGLLIVFLPMIFENNEDQKNVEYLLTSPTDNNPTALEKPTSNTSDSAVVLTDHNALDADTTAFFEQPDSDGIDNNSSSGNSESNSKDTNLVSTKISADPQKSAKKSDISRVIKYSIDKNQNIASNSIYAIKIATVRKKNVAEHIKNLLMAKGFPAYINYNDKRNRYTVYTGPDLELKYIQELANRIITETDYEPEIVAHNKDWLTE